MLTSRCSRGHAFPVEPLVKTCSAALPLCLFFTGNGLVASLTSFNESPFCQLIEKSCQSLLVGVFRIETIERERLEGEKERFHLVLRWMEDKHPWYAQTAPAFEARVFAHPLFNEAPCASSSVGSPAAHLFIAIVCLRCRCAIDRLDWIGWKCLRCQTTYQARQLTIERDVPFGRLPIIYTGPRMDNGKAAVDLTRFSRELYVWSDHVKVGLFCLYFSIVLVSELMQPQERNLQLTDRQRCAPLDKSSSLISPPLINGRRAPAQASHALHAL